MSIFSIIQAIVIRRTEERLEREAGRKKAPSAATNEPKGEKEPDL
jgi:hypothetical protein